MFTSSGSSILAKYVLGQLPDFATHIAIGCGRKPSRSTSYTVTNKQAASGTATLTFATHDFEVGDYITVSGVGSPFDSSASSRYQVTGITATTISYTITSTSTIASTSASGTVILNFAINNKLKFETYRSKIISKGYVNNNGTPELSLIAELPTNDRYAISEIALFPAAQNPNAKDFDSRVLLNFSDEAYTINSTTSISPSTINIPSNGTISDIGSSQAFFVASADGQWTSDTRLQRLEAPRFLNKCLLLKSTSTQAIDAKNLNIDLSKNSPEDYLSLAYSFVSNTASVDSTGVQNTYTVTIKFFNSNNSNYYSYSFVINSANTATERYRTAIFQIKDLVASAASATLSNINDIQISIAKTSGSATETYWLLLDGLRLDAVSSYNSSFDMVACRQIVNSVTINNTAYPTPIIKEPNTTNFIEFRFSLDVA